MNKQVCFRKPSRYLSYRKRYLALSSNHQVQCRKIKRQLLCCLLLREDDHLEEAEDLDKVVDLLIVKYLSHTMISPSEIMNTAIPILRRSINSFSISDSPIFFGFQLNDLHTLFDLLKIPDIITFDNRMSLPGEDLFLRGLYELKSGEIKHNIGVNVFGGDSSVQSRAFLYFIHFIYSNFKHLVQNNLDYISLS